MNIDFTYVAGPKGSKLSQVVENAMQKRRQDAQLRLARIANRKLPSHCNGGRCAGK